LANAPAKVSLASDALITLVPKVSANFTLSGLFLNNLFHLVRLLSVMAKKTIYPSALSIPGHSSLRRR
jgi:hypothetical protein